MNLEIFICTVSRIPTTQTISIQLTKDFSKRLFWKNSRKWPVGFPDVTWVKRAAE